MLLIELSSVCLYKEVLRDKAVEKLVALLKMIISQDADAEKLVEIYSGIYAILLKGNAAGFFSYVSALLYADENTFTLSCEGKEMKTDSPILRQAERDLVIMERMASIRCGDIKKKMKELFSESPEMHILIDNLPDWNMRCDVDRIPLEKRILWHRKNGAGIFSQHSFFIWDGEERKPVPVKNPDSITLDRLYLVDSQKETAFKNTEVFMSGSPANNVLFYGDRGTGKSSMVKAIANEFSVKGLRLIEVPKKFLYQIPVITSMLSFRNLKFILFIDDLAFANNEEEYTALKAVLEGGIEHKPSNIILYATSNRRHLVKERFADRKGVFSDNPDEEIRARDGIQEKLSLADRFGITIVFTSPIKKEYLEIICKIAEEEKICIDNSLLEQKAMQWEMTYNGMSPRTARQFINWLKASVDDTTAKM